MSFSVLHHDKISQSEKFIIPMPKHPNVEFRKLVVKIRNLKKKKEIYPLREMRKIHWKEYTLSKINEFKIELDFIRKSVNEIDFIEEKNIGRPSINLRYLVKAILVCELFNCPERQAQGLLEIISKYIGIHDVLDD